MDIATVCLLIGIGVLLLGALGSKKSKSVHSRRRWIFWIGMVLVLIGLILGLKDCVRAARDEFKEETTSSGK